MSTTIAVKTGGVWRGPSRTPLPDPVGLPDTPARFTDTNPSWVVPAGENLLDNIPAGIPVVNASAYSTSTDLYTALTAVGNGYPNPCYVRLDAAPRYYVNTFRSTANNWIGWQNNIGTATNRKVMGLIGLGADQTSICVPPTAVNDSPQAARDWVLAATKTGGPVPMSAIYFTGSSTTVPFFFSGISFDGTLQGPFGVYNTTVQAQFNRNQGVASPLAWRGMSLWRANPGSRMQFCRFRGFGYSLLNAPPFEMGALDMNYSNGFVFHQVDIDGRIAAEFDPARPLASGGLMWNKDINILARNVWIHHTRRSGWATNTNTGRTDESYNGQNVQCHNITGLDGYASGGGFFPGSNIEGVVGTFTYNDIFFSTGTEQHIYLAIPYSGGPPQPYTVPDRPIIVVRGFSSTDPTYNGCLRISVPKQPNSSGQSPAWTKLNALGIEGSNLFDIRRSDGTPLVGVRSTSFNGAIHKPNTHFVVTYAV